MPFQTNILSYITFLVIIIMLNSDTSATTSVNNNQTSVKELISVNIDTNNTSNTIQEVIYAHFGDIIEINLKGNPTTGYTYRMIDFPNTSIIKPLLIDPLYTQDHTTEYLLGVGGTFTFKFQAMSAGETSASLVYARHFEHRPIYLIRVDVTFKILTSNMSPSNKLIS
ncbi:uncharacterized protein CMU_007980 [Cryptosporidium muris RN66]|uniref:Proteinase inhibitor I42 chagasin domain-containing protein n=1 Tax=Cryptosporidium muris (strain RN66) TaxID=441375 RepID=B6ADL6_CRYMR|nr:uncharacterized protein CMU_007980 [Cryptosporidium muris RN66]EEA06307.1 hypothetical protein, conserved [Cryptosporidium muris RN66]|eukprot:XP_002140656.1 hypothetical protein [Cryptosporidium muris RN66]